MTTLPADLLELEPGLPLRLSPRTSGCGLGDVSSALHALVDQHLETAGGMLLHGFADPGVAGFQAFATGFGHPLLNYEFGSTPRSRVTADGVYTSTEYPARQWIPLHNEQAYTCDWPMRIWFYCAQAAEEGGETPIADSRQVFARLDPALRRRFAERRLSYVRNYGNGLDVAWQQVFDTEDRATVERFCAARGIACEWKADGELRTRQLCQGVARHPRTGDWVWFNQAHLFHASNLAPEVRASLIDLVGEDQLPRNVCWADGSTIDDAILDQVRAVLAAETVIFPWQPGDVLMLDNMLVAHARTPFSGPRKVVVAMSRSHTNLD